MRTSMPGRPKISIATIDCIYVVPLFGGVETMTSSVRKSKSAHIVEFVTGPT